MRWRRCASAVFRDWPYLYEGDVAYEREYLDAYARSANSIVVLARDGDVVVGASTGIPLAEDSAEFQAPFHHARHRRAAKSSIAANPCCCRRGAGAASAMPSSMLARRMRVRLAVSEWTAFAAVDRDAGDPRRPPGHRGNEVFWGKRGYVRQPGMTMRLHWNESGKRRHRPSTDVLAAATARGHTRMKVAACKYPVGEPRDFAAFAAKQEALLGEAKARGAQLAVLPEYLSLELAAMFDDATRGDLHASLAAIQPLRDDWLALYAGLARRLGMAIVAGSFLLDGGRGRYRNRSDFFAADGGHLLAGQVAPDRFREAHGCDRLR